MARRRLRSEMIPVKDDPMLYGYLSSFVGGENTRMRDQNLAENMGTSLVNADLLVQGHTGKRYGTSLIGSDLGSVAIAGMGLMQVSGGTDQMLVAQGTTVSKWTGSGSFSSVKADFASGTDYEITVGGESGEGDVFFARSSGNWFRINVAGTADDLNVIDGAITAFADAGGGQVTVTSASHGLSDGYSVTITGTTNYNGTFTIANSDTNTFEITDTWVSDDATGTWTYTNTNINPPLSNISIFFMNRWWIADDDLLYYSDAYSSDYSRAWDRTSNAFRFVGGGAIKAIYPVRINGANMIVVFKESSSWLLNINTTTIGSSVIEPLDLNVGCVGRHACTQVGDDVWFMSADGIRSVVKSQLDRARAGSSNALTFLIKDEIDAVNWSYMDKVVCTYFKGMFLMAYPTGASQYNNRVMVGYPQFINQVGAKDAYPSWSIFEGLNVAQWCKYYISGEERLYYGNAGADGLCYRFWDDTVLNDNSASIPFEIATRAMDFGLPQQTKYGGECEIRADSGEGILTVSAQVDDAGWAVLGTMDLDRSVLTIPIAGLPFDLDSAVPISQKFHLDSLGQFRKIEIKVECDEANSDIKIFSIAVATFQDEYMGE